MSNVAKVTECPECGTTGNVISRNRAGIETNYCPNCKNKWNTLDAKKAAEHKRLLDKTKCPICSNPSGYPGGGICIRCYKEGHRSA